MGGLNQSAAAPLPTRLGGRGWRVIGTGLVRRKAQAWIVPQLAAHGIGMQARPDSVRLAGFLLPAERQPENWSPQFSPQ